jgi:hypothetical protein
MYFDKKRFGNFLGHFFTNSSGHSEQELIMQHLRTKKTSYDTNEQGDQIRRVFINFVIVYTSDSFCANFWSTSFSSKNCVSILTKNGLGYILGHFFPNSSGRPANE